VKLRPEVPAEAGAIVARSLQKDPAKRYQTAAEVVADASALLLRMSGPLPEKEPKQRAMPIVAVTLIPMFLVVFAGLFWQYHRYSQRQWVREEAIPQMESLRDAKKPLAAFLVMEKAEKILPKDEQLKAIAAAHTIDASVETEPAGAEVAIQDYMTPGGEWLKLGTTPLKHVRLPKGYFRWKVSKAGFADLVQAWGADTGNDFSLTDWQKAPAGMVPAPGGTFATYEGFLGWYGPYQLPPYYVDKFEVTNREYQKFVDDGGYTKKQYWPAEFTEDGKSVSWDAAMEKFRDTSGRPGPATWEGGHYPEGQADYPVAGVSWYEAMAYAASVGKTLPVVAQRYDLAPEDVEEYVVAESNIAGSGLAKVGAYQGLGPYGTYDTAGNVREWNENAVADHDLRFIIGGSWQSPLYIYTSPEALPAFDRSATNGFRCVLNSKALPPAAVGPVHRLTRDFSVFKPVSDEVFSAYKLLYAYPNIPLNAKVDGIVKETVDWTEVKVTFDAAYDGERMAAYLFLPKTMKPPFQTVLFFPSARVQVLTDSSSLGDLKFFDYILQSGRAVMYPVYQDTYERRTRGSVPGGGQDVNLTVDWYKDAARSLDYLATRKDIDSSRLAYLGVSMGAADGVILSSLLQDRLKTAIFLDGGYFLAQPRAGGDQAEFAVRLKMPVLMVNGKYDYTFSVQDAQDPLFKMLGTPEAEKKHVLLDTPHDVTEDRDHLKKAVLDWMDQYLGRVN